METNPLTDEHKAIREVANRTVDLADPDLARIVRLRLLSDPGFPFYDVSYCYGRTRDGEYVRVRLPEFQFPRRGLTRALVEMCRREGVYAKGLGLLDGDVISLLA